MDIKSENMIGQGNTAEIFQLEDGRILKLFRNGLDKSVITHEYENSLTVQEALDFVPHAYEMIEYEGRSGIIYQKIAGIDMLKQILGKLWKINFFSKQLAAYHIAIQKPIKGNMKTVKEKLKDDIEHVNELSQEEKNRILSYMQTLPDGNTLCHFDFHPGNIMIAEEKVYILDWMTACKGDACADIMRTNILLNYGEYAHIPWLIKQVITVFQHHIYNIYIQEYLRCADCTSADIMQWKLPVVAARLREWITDHEKDRLLQMVKTMLAEQKVGQGVADNEN